MRDSASVCSQNQDLTGQIAGTVLSTKSVDLGVAGTPPDAFQAVGSIIADFGRGRPIFAECRVTTAFTSGSSTGTVVVQCVMADDAALATNLVVIDETAAIIVTTLVAGYRFRLGSVPAGITKEFLGFRYTVAVDTITAGQLWAEYTLSKIDKPVTS